jgi:two-component sensor histidine kinase
VLSGAEEAATHKHDRGEIMPTFKGVEVSDDELSRFFEIGLGSLSGMYHDLSNGVSGILISSMTMEERIESGQAPSLDDIRSFTQRVRGAAQHLRRIMTHYQMPDASDGSLSFFADLDSIINAIKGQYPEAVSQGACEPPSLRFLYPHTALFTVMHELVANSVEHSAKGSNARVSWSLRPGWFSCVIDDSGPGVSSDLSNAFLPLDALQYPSRRSGGLRIVQRVVRLSDGLLLFRRSSALGGTQALFELPVRGYWKDEEFRENS